MTDSIVYLTISKPGGVDGRDHNDKGGQTTGAYMEKARAQAAPGREYNEIRPVVMDLDRVLAETWNKLTPVERLALINRTLPTNANLPMKVPPA